jgi:nicotinamide riboside kinase
MVEWIGVTGPESSGKTTLATELSIVLEGVLVPEYSRMYLGQMGPSYTFEDIIHISRGQVGLENRALHSTNRPIVSDTSLEVLELWSRERFNRVSKELEAWRERPVDCYLLCKPDLPWEEDPLRENPFDRDRLFEQYLGMLKAQGKSVHIVSGQADARLQSALNFLKTLA